MFVLVLAAENDETRQTVSFLIICLVGIAVALSALTIWYWLYTDPKRRREAAGTASRRSSLIDEPEQAVGGAIVGQTVEPESGADSERETDTDTETRLGVLAEAAAVAVSESGPEPERAAEPAPALAPLGEVAMEVRPGEREVDHHGSAVGIEVAAGSVDAFVSEPLMARQTWDFVAAAKRAESHGGPPSVVPLSPSAPRIAVPNRGGSAGVMADDDADDPDELAVVRRRREREAARGISDEVWQSVRRSVFDKLDS